MTENNNSITYQLLRESCPYLDSLDKVTLEELINLSHELAVKAGELVWQTEQTVDHACIVLKGGFATVFTRDWGEDRILEQIGVGELLAEAEVLNGDKCHSDIRALEDSTLLYIPRQFFISLAMKYAALWQYLSERGRSRTSRLLITTYINNLFGTAQHKITEPLLRLKAEEQWLNFEHEVLEKINETAEWTKLERGEYLFHQGDAPDNAYIIVSGVVRVLVKQEDGEEHEVARMSQGEIVGELAFIADENRSASIEAIRDCELFRLAPDLLNRVAEKYPRVMLNVYRTISKRFRRPVDYGGYRPKKPNIAILPIADNGVLNEFIENLHQTMSGMDSVKYIDSQILDEQLGHTDIANISRNNPNSFNLMQWLNGQELLTQYLIYRADNEWSEWTMRCVHQADTVILLVDATSMPEFSKLKQELSAAGQEWSMIMLHPENTVRPRGCAKWRIESGAKEIYHARVNNIDDINRVARILTDRAISLVLGGGGARGCAYIGALRALEEMNIKIDMVGGTSSGSTIAAWVAQGNSSEQCHKLASAAFRKIFDFTIPVTSLLKGKHISQAISQQTASWDIEDYWLPFFCVSTNLTTASQVIHRTGNSARALRASVSIPGVFPPVPENGEILVDGGVLNNLPIDIMREINKSGTILAIDVVSPRGVVAKEDFGMSLSGSRQLLRLLIPWLSPQRAPSIGAVIMQSMMAGSSLLREQILHKKLADFYLNIHVKGIGMMEFSRIDRAVELGYDSYIEPLRQWLKHSDIQQKQPANDHNK